MYASGSQIPSPTGKQNGGDQARVARFFSGSKTLQEQSNAHPSRQLVWFGLHLAAVYLTVFFFSVWLAGRFHDWVIPLVDPGNRTSSFQFVFSHLFAFTFIPAFVAGLFNVKYKHKSALLVWTVPAAILAYKLITFPASVFQNHFEAALHHYFAGGFIIGEFHNFNELFTTVATNSDAVRGMDQLRFTGPLYAGIGYSIATVIALRLPISNLKKVFTSRD